MNTVEIRRVNKNDQDVIALRQHFQKRAITLEKAAKAIIKGIKKNQLMIFTSLDIRVGYWFQRKFSLPYRLVIQ